MGSKNPKVDAWFEKYDNPQKELVQRVREVVLAADERVTEDIKWQAPTFIYKGNIASFFPKAKKNVSLMFHQGASIPDPLALLEGEGETSRVARFEDFDDLEEKTEALRAVVRGWIQMKDQE